MSETHWSIAETMISYSLCSTGIGFTSLFGAFISQILASTGKYSNIIIYLFKESKKMHILECFNKINLILFLKVYYTVYRHILYFIISHMTKRKKFAAAVNFYLTESQKKKIEFILEAKWQSLTDFLRNHIQTTIEKHEDKHGTINIYQTYIV